MHRSIIKKLQTGYGEIVHAIEFLWKWLGLLVSAYWALDLLGNLKAFTWNKMYPLYERYYEVVVQVVPRGYLSL